VVSRIITVGLGFSYWATPAGAKGYRTGMPVTFFRPFCDCIGFREEAIADLEGPGRRALASSKRRRVDLIFLDGGVLGCFGR